MTKIIISKSEDKINNIFEGFKKDELSPRGKKLLKEWKGIDHLSENSDVIDYIVRKRNREGLPVEYEVIYRLKSIVGVSEPVEDTIGINGNTQKKTVRKPIFGNEHHLRISLPNNYPGAFGGNPEFVMISDTWHPNIRSSGKFKGRICLNDRDLGVAIGLVERIIRVGKYLQYQVYWANDSYPWPEDQGVAEWVREEAEPAGWINAPEGLFVDDSRLYKGTVLFQNKGQRVFSAEGSNREKPGSDAHIIIKKK